MRIFAIEPNQFFSAFLFVVVAFIAAVLATPILTDFLYKNKIGKKIRDTDHEGNKTPIFNKLHSHKENTPTMGGILIWGAAALITLVANFSRSTLLPLFTIVASGVIGGIDDLMNVFGVGAGRGGMRFAFKFIFYFIVASLGAFWFAYKLEWIHRGFFIPGAGDVILGYWYIPLFIAVLIFIAFAWNQTDGLDGLAGGTFAIAFGAYTLIGLFRGNYPLAVFCATILGTTLAFLWFNIHPARFFMGDTGSMSLGMALGVIAFLTNTVYLLPFIAFIPMIEAITTIIQIVSKKVFRRKVFRIAPIHHHFEALGWPETKVTMRFWIISALSTVIGLSLALILG
jgi:phospho-N-acetylmuramoyl-pentapeptide-transferase